MARLDDQGSLETNDTGPAVEDQAPLLFDGQRLDQPTFHELYLLTPNDFKAELIEGVVSVMSSPVNPRHARPFVNMTWFLKSYSVETMGTFVLGDSTTKLGPGSEVQPDCALLLEAQFGGQTSTDAMSYTTGCPELVVEISSSTLHIDLNLKKKIYEQAKALEYIVFDEPHRRFHWFALQGGRFEPVNIDADGLYRSRAFPGLWLDAAAFLRDDGRAVMAGLRRGLESPEHAVFVERLHQYRVNRP